MKIEIKETRILEEDGWNSEYTVEAMGFKVVDQSRKLAMVTLKSRINNALDKLIESG